MQEKTKEKIKRIYQNMSMADSIYRTIPDEDQDEILRIHGESSSLPHCIRWGLQASEEMIKIPVKEE